MQVHTFTEAGGHPHNEDAVRVEPHPSDPSVLLVALADGQGGRAGGGRAAHIAVDTAVTLAHQLAPSAVDRVAWAKILPRVDAAVAADPSAGFTTLVAFTVFANGWVAGGACGDSAVLLADTTGHTLLTQAQRKNPPVGTGDAEFVAFDDVPVSPWQLVAMSDGVWKYAGWEDVYELAAELRGRALIDALAARARLPGSGTFPDDFTLAVVSSD